MYYIWYIKPDKMTKKEETIIIRVEPMTKEKLNKMAKDDSRTLSNYVRMILEKVASGEIKA
jgi:predicted DNA-binding protein